MCFENISCVLIEGRRVGGFFVATVGKKKGCVFSSIQGWLLSCVICTYWNLNAKASGLVAESPALLSKPLKWQTEPLLLLYL